MAKIASITGREVLDSRGMPTVEATVVTHGGHVGVAKVPSGISKGRYEVLELRDGDEGRYGGQGVLKAVSHVTNDIQAILKDQDTANQSKIDRLMLELDGTVDKSRLGANALLAVSCACARAEAASQGVELYEYLQQLYPNQKPVMPVPQMNLINGGGHASNNLSIQEYHVLPVGSPNFSEALRMGVEIYQALRSLLIEAGFQVEVAREGGFAPKLEQSEQAFDFLVAAITKAGYVPGVDAFLGIDAAASEFYSVETTKYTLDGAELSAVDLAYQYKTWQEKYPLLSIEDPFAEDSWDDWHKFMVANGDAVQIVGDDLYVTNRTRIREGIKQQATNAVLIKLNQVGTLTETLQAIETTQQAEQNVIISHRSGETEDVFIADLSIAVGAGQIKTGASSGSDRVAKYNRLLTIEDLVGGDLSHSLQRFLEQIRPRFDA